jgi:hypothetical protein
MSISQKVLSCLLFSCALLAMGKSAFALPNQFICAAAETIACAQDEPCVRGSANSVNLPLIWKVALKEKSVVSIREGGEQRNSEIFKSIEGEDALILYGLDQGAAWTAIISTSDGKMTMTSSTYDAGYIVHGGCSSKILE